MKMNVFSDKLKAI